MISDAVIDRILARCEWGPNGCLVWTGASTPKGYGVLNDRGKILYVHRIACEFYYGSPLPGGVVRHHCDNPPCVHKDHMCWGTSKENARDRIERRMGAASGHCVKGHFLDGNQVFRTNGQSAGCRLCRRSASQEWRKRHDA